MDILKLPYKKNLFYTIVCHFLVNDTAREGRVREKKNTKCDMKGRGFKNAFMSDVLFEYSILDLYATYL